MGDRDGLLIPVNKLIEFKPTRLGEFALEFAKAATTLSGLPQTEVRERLKQAAEGCEDQTSSGKAFRATLLILRDYVDSGYYPLSQDGKVFVASLLEARNIGTAGRGQALRLLYRQARSNALREPVHRKTLDRTLDIVNRLDYRPENSIESLIEGAPDLQLTVAQHGTQRMLWRAVRSTWSMTPDASAPGREVSILITDRKTPDTPLGVAQFRNVVPEIRCRDSWLGLTSRNSDGGPGGYIDRLEAGEDQNERLRATSKVLRTLLAAVNTEGLPELGLAGGQQQAAALQLRSASYRLAYNDARKNGKRAEARDLLAKTKRAETAAELSLGLAGLAACIDAEAPVKLLRESAATRKLVDAGLRKIWHYHMGFVALEMSVCGAAPPFGPFRLGKLAAAVAGSEVVLSAWGRDRPLGEIAATVYRPEVRALLPNPGPLVVFTSGLYPGHSSQYNRASSGGRRWLRIGETRGFGSFHIATDTIDAIDKYNEAADGYSHITRSFGEGASARFRAIGRALSSLGLPDLRRHDTRRPLYALPLVEDPGAVLLGWAEASNVVGASETDLANEWWERWVRPRRHALAQLAHQTPDLLDELSGLLREVGAAPEQNEQLRLAL
ncbi:Druantia anti-phage system protein DruA [Streptacidiphilus sp. N1-12]|uniref:Druantia anti-phage system protein DruA n=2 Tax=Streptacidiphilus alkalitolerans TaxID=3342712 RepID=A0ABV6WMM5_9ACTN